MRLSTWSESNGCFDCVVIRSCSFVRQTSVCRSAISLHSWGEGRGGGLCAQSLSSDPSPNGRGELLSDKLEVCQTAKTRPATDPSAFGRTSGRFWKSV